MHHKSLMSIKTPKGINPSRIILWASPKDWTLNHIFHSSYWSIIFWLVFACLLFKKDNPELDCLVLCLSMFLVQNTQSSPAETLKSKFCHCEDFITYIFSISTKTLSESSSGPCSIPLSWQRALLLFLFTIVYRPQQGVPH